MSAYFHTCTENSETVKRDRNIYIRISVHFQHKEVYQYIETEHLYYTYTFPNTFS